MSTAAFPPAPRSFRFSAVGAASVALVVAGLLLGVTAGMQWLVLFALGAFGPALLREVGVLRDHDEFQRALSLRAGHRAYVVCGLFLCAVIVARQWGEANLDHDAISASASLAFLLVTYYLTYLTGFWGAQRASARILLTFGTIWLAFVVLSHGQEALSGHAVELGAELLLVVPFFALAWACGRWPRVAGVLLLVASLLSFVLFRLHRVVSGDHSAIVVTLLFALPLAWCGVALLTAARE